jgi:predicted ATPase
VPGNNDVSLRNIASGVKSIAVIIRGFRNDTIHRGDILIIDEPESNLHPEWQLSFAKFLVLLHVRLDMRILLNTHSPYFLKAIQIYSDTLEQGDKCTFYNMTSAYGCQYKAECLTGERIQEIFKSMSMPFARLMHGEHYERSIS